MLFAKTNDTCNNYGTQEPLYAAYVNLKAAFDSVYRPALWKLLRVVRVHEKIIPSTEGGATNLEKIGRSKTMQAAPDQCSYPVLYKNRTVTKLLQGTV